MPSQSITDPPQVDPGFHRHIIPPADEERRLLEENLLRDGCRDPLVVWAETGLLLDGHNRLAICQQHGLNYQVESISLPDRDAALDWIDTNQAGRRNMRPDDLKLVIGRIYNRRKMSKAEAALVGSRAAAAKRAAVADEVSPTWEKATSVDNAAAVAEQFGVDRTTIFKASKFAAVYDSVKEWNPDVPHDKALAIAKKATARPRPRPNEEALGKALRIIRDAYGDAGLEAVVIDGIGHLCQRYNGQLDEQQAVSKLGGAHGGVNGLLGKAEVIKKQTGAGKNLCVAAAAVEFINSGKGGKKLPGWWSE